MLAGEAQARTAIRAELPVDLAEICVDVDRGDSGDDTAEQVLADELRRVVSEYSAERAAERTEQFHTAAVHQLPTDGAPARSGRPHRWQRSRHCCSPTTSQPAGKRSC